MNGYYKITEILKTILEVDNDVKTVNKGIIQDVLLKKADLYPYVHIIINNATNQGNINTFNVSVIAMDIVDISKEQTTDIFRGQNNRDDVLNTMFAVLSRMITIIERGDSTHLYQLTGTPNYEPFEDRFEHGVAGWTVTFDVVLPDDMTVCDFETPRDFCAASNYTISDGSGNVLYTGSIASGGTLTQVISDSTVTNSLGTVLASIDAEGTAQLADVNNIDSDGSTVPTPAGVAFTCTPAANATLTVNTSAFLTVASGSTTDISLVDQDDLDITPISLTGGTIKVNIPSGGTNSAPLMKTNQTVSYGTGDDGDKEQGRGVSFLVLDHNNYFGNTNRFTDTAGGQTYSNDIVLDWSTYNSSTGEVLAYYKAYTSTLDWTPMLNAVNSATLGGFTGWNVPNRTQFNNIINLASGAGLNYAPFSLTFAGNYWTSSASFSDSAQKYYLNTAHFVISIFSSDTGVSMRTIPVRIFNTSEL